MSEELNELKKISRLLILANGEAIEKELSNYATTDERKKLWIFIDGEKQPNELSDCSGVKIAAVYNFLKALTSASLIENLHGKPPKKVIEYVPASWLELIKPAEKKQKEENKDNESG
jgi:hypothetical protein